MITPGRADLTSLFAPPAGSEPFRQGEVLTYNPATGANTVRVGDAVLTNLPLLNIGDTINLQAGNAVILLKFRSSWAILGRVVTPGSSTVQSAAVEFATLSAYADNFPVTTTWTDRATGTVPVPTWANQASFVVVGLLGALNSTAGSDILQGYVDVDGNVGNVPYFDVDAGDFASLTPSLAQTMTVTGGSTITASLVAATSGSNWATDINNRAGLQGTFIFRKA